MCFAHKRQIINMHRRLAHSCVVNMLCLGITYYVIAEPLGGDSTEPGPETNVLFSVSLRRYSTTSG